MKYVIFVLSFIAYSSVSYSAEVPYLFNKMDSRDEIRNLEFACKFYGLDIKEFLVTEQNILYTFQQVVKEKKPPGIILSADILGKPGIINEIIRVINAYYSKKPALLITGLSPKTNLKHINIITNNEIIKIEGIDQIPLKNSYYKITNDKALNQELSDLTLPLTFFARSVRFGFQINPSSNNQIIIKLINNEEQLERTIFNRFIYKEIHFFLLSGVNSEKNKSIKKDTHIDKEIIDVLPFLIFLKHYWKEECWRASGDFANLTIDDPWLTEPYGFLNYNDLLNEMQKNGFHTTIAFIPWNFDRSDDEIIKIFVANKNYYSICFHGNNHDHREFGQNRLVSEQRNDIVQAIKRMEYFSETTGLKSDKVMVFPHGISPRKTLGILKKYNFIGTCNYTNTPIGEKQPDEREFLYRTTSLFFENFPSIRRFPVFKKITEEYKAIIAINLFLDNPIIFYTHHDYFKGSIQNFNLIVQMIEELQPEIEWNSLGNIFQKLYLIRHDSDKKHFFVKSYSSNIILENKSSQIMTYSVLKDENFIPPIKNLLINGINKIYKQDENSISFNLKVGPNEKKNIIIEYQNDIDKLNINISKDKFYHYILRMISDFRDLYLSKTFIGDKVISLYYSKSKKIILFTAFAVFIVFIIFIIITRLIFIKYFKRPTKQLL